MASISDDFGGSGPGSSNLTGTVTIGSGTATSSSTFGGFRLYDQVFDSSDLRASVEFDMAAEPALFIAGDGTYSYPWPNGYVAKENGNNWILLRNGTSVDTAFHSTSGNVVMMLEVISGVVKAYADGVEVLSYTDGSPLTNKRCGFGWSYISSPGTANQPFAAEDVGGAAATSSPLNRSRRFDHLLRR